MFNKVFLIGNLVADPEYAVKENNDPMVKFRIACTEKYKSKADNTIHEDTLFIQCVVWKKQAEAVNKYLTKGARVFVEGRLKIKESEKDGIRKWFTSVHVLAIKFLDSKPKTESKPDTPETDPEEIPFS